MENLILLFALCFSQFIVVTRCTAQEKDQKVDFESKMAAISQSIETLMKLHDVPAVSACVVTGNESFFINHGTLNRRSDKKVDEKSIYQIASLSKTFVGLIAHEMVQNETINSNDSIADYLPGKIDDSTMQKVKPISILDLTCHRSGLPRDTLNPKSRQAGTYVNYDYDETDLLKDLNEMELAFAPGDRFMYSNFGYSLLAYLLERASGKNYSQLVQEYVTRRMKMLDTGFELDQNQSDRLVTPYDHKNPSVAREPASIGKLGPPTSLYSTTSDLANLMKKQLAEYRQYQKTKKVTNLILTQHPKEAWQGTGIRYGFGFFDWGDGTIGHGGGMDGYGSEFTFDPKGNFGFILLTSSGEAWTQRLTVAVNNVMTDGKFQALDELVAVESIIAEFEQRGPGAALETYQKFRSREPSPLGENSRVTLVNLARKNGLTTAAKLFVSDALADFPQSKRINGLANSLGDQ